jgi:phosphotransferase system enzyme I (PtsI)
LIQYTLGDRRAQRPHCAHLYQPTHPAMLRTLRTILFGGRARNKLPAVCVAKWPAIRSTLRCCSGLGATSLSMAPPLIPTVKYLVRNMKMADARKFAKEMLELRDPKEIQTRCEEFYRERTKELSLG